MNANARAFLSLARVAAPSMPAGSSIVAISSLGSIRVLENYVLVGTSKAALESLVRYLAVELGHAASASTRSRAESSRRARSSTSRTGRRCWSWARATPPGGSSLPEDIAGAVAFLCSGDAEMVRGQTLIVDGGFSLTA